MAKLTIHCLGAFQASLDNEPLPFDTDKSRALLAYLALEGAQPQRRERLAGLLWSDTPEERALHNLRQALSGLRKALCDEANSIPFLLIQRDTVQVNPSSDFWLDVTTFEKNLDAALHPYQRCPGPQASGRLNIRQLQRIVTLFRGPFLDQLYLNGSPLFDEWASLKRERLNQRMIEALTTLAELHERRGETALARETTSQVLALAPWDETAHAQVMRLLAVEGQWSAAQAQYRHLRRYLQEQLGVEPAPETLALFEQIRRNAAQNIPLPARLPLARHNLPLNTSPIIGRESELDAIADGLADPCCRLLTLIGPGGVGKTRLAIETARGQVGIFADGVYFVPLAALSTDELLPAALADAVGFTFFGNDPAPEQLLHFLGEKHILLLLDNLEQLLPLSPDGLIVQILQHAPRTVILAASRQRLHLQEECLFPVTGLAYAKQTSTRSDEPPAAIQLFANRAQRVLPAFNLFNDANLEAATHICQLLEGLPLGVELAAAALWSHTPAEIAASLRGSLHSLESTAINADDRHRSLWAAFDVSWGLLSDDERILLARLSVFRGGFEGEMALSAVEASPALLAALMDKSLLRRSAAGRYDLHEAIRQFAAEKLSQNKAQVAYAYNRHSQVLTGFLAARIGALKSSGQVQALSEIALEWKNARQAWHWLVSSGNANALAACAEAIFHFCTIRTRYLEGIDLFSHAAASLGGFPAVQAKILTFEGALAYRVLENEQCEATLEQALALFASLDAPNDLALCLIYASGLAYRRKKPALARQRCEQSLALFEQTGDGWGKAYALYQLGLLESRAGRVPEAQQAFHASLQVARAIGDQRRQIGPLNLLGDLNCQLGAYAESQTYFEEGLALSRHLDDRFNTALTLVNLGTTFHYTQRYAQAQRCYLESLDIAREIGDLGGQSLALTNLGELSLVQQKYAEGLAYCQQGLVLAEKAGDEWAILIGWTNLADAALGLGDLAAASEYLAQAIPLAVQSQEPALVLRALLHQGRWYLAQGENKKALQLLGLVIHHETTYEEHREAARQALAQYGFAIPLKNELLVALSDDLSWDSIAEKLACVA